MDLAKLVVKLEAQTAQYMNALDAAEKRLQKFEKTAVSIGGVGAAAASVIVAIGTASVAMGKAAIDAADHMNDLSKSTGLSTESLSQFEFAAKQSGLDIETLAKSTAKLQRTQVEAAKGGKEAAKAFNAVGVSVKNADGSLKSTEELLLDVAEAFSQYEDGAAKTAIAQELFGKSGQQMIPFLNEGRDGLEKLMKQADALGITISGKTAKAADQFNDNLGAMGAAAKGVFNQLLSEMLPVLIELSDSFIGAAESGGALEFAVKSLAVVFKSFVTAGVIVKSIFQQLGRVIYGAAAALVRVANGEFSLAAQELKDAFADASENVAGDIDTITKVWGDAAPAMEKNADKMDKALKKSIVFNDEKAAEEAKKARDAALESLAGMEQGLLEQVETFGMADDAIMKYRVSTGDLAVTLDKAGEAGKVYGDTIVALAEQLQELKEKQDAAREAQAEMNALINEALDVAKAVRTPLEVYEDEIARLNRLMEAGVLTQDTYNRAVEAAQDAYKKASKAQNKFLEEANRNVQDILADGIRTGLKDGFEKGAKGALDAFVDMLEKMAAEAIAANLAAKIFGPDGMGSGGGWLGKIGLNGSKGILPGDQPINTGGFQLPGGGGGWMDTAIDFLGGIFGGWRDSGGRGSPGVAYAIGIDEEYFVPDRPGMFVTGEQMRRGGNVTQNIHVTGQVTQRSARQLELEAARRQSIAKARIG